MGIDGIAVGLSTKILPHNFNEVIDAGIKYLKNKPFELYPDFFQGGQADISNYQEGVRGGKVKVRAKIEEIGKNKLEITEIPYGTTTSSIIDSVLSAHDKGKLKISKIEDNTAARVSIEINLPKGSDAETSIQQLYAFSDCEVTLSPLACVIKDKKPHFLKISEILTSTIDQTRELLRQELEYKRNALLDKWHMKSLEKIFIEKEIYEVMKKCNSNEEIYYSIDKELKPYTKKLKKEVSEEDIIKLTEIKIKRISKFDIDNARKELKAIEDEIKLIEAKLADITRYTISYLTNIKKKYGKDHPRRTELKSFSAVNAVEVARTNMKLYQDDKGYIGTDLKNANLITACSSLDDVIFIKKNGQFSLIKLPSKLYVGEDTLYVNRFIKNDPNTVYNMIYFNSQNGNSYVKRFTVGGLIRDKQYQLFSEGTILYFSTEDDPKLKIKLSGKGIRKTSLDLDFSTILVKGRSAIGKLLTRYTITKITPLSKQPSEPEGDSGSDLVQGQLFNSFSKK